MKKIFFIGIVAMIASICSSCSKDSDNQQPDAPEDKSEYYVKFEASCIGAYSHLNNISVSTSNGGYGTTNYTGRSFSETFGPVPKGSKASISVFPTGTSAGNVTTSIYISKDNGPFALKARGKDKCSYTIDF